MVLRTSGAFVGGTTSRMASYDLGMVLEDANDVWLG